MINPTTYWPGKAVGRFVAPAISEPSTAEFRDVAADYIARVAPTLPPLAAQVLAGSVTQFLFADPGSDSPDDLPGSLRPYERWYWPDLAVAVPFSLSDGGRGLAREVWEDDNWHYLFEARLLADEVSYTDLRAWFWAAPMTLVRNWRKKYLPDLVGRQRKFVILNRLANLKPFPEPIKFEYEQWRVELLTSAQELRSKAAEAPVPRHFEWLSQLVRQRLRSHYHANYSAAGPAAYERLTRALLTTPVHGLHAAATKLAQQVEFEFARHRLPAFFRTPEYEPGVELAKHKALAEIGAWFRDMVDEGKLKKRLRKITHKTELNECRLCSQRRRRHKGGALPPFDIKCTCSLTSLNEERHGLFHTTPDRATADLAVWAMQGYAGIERPEMDWGQLIIACNVALYMEDLEARMDEELRSVLR